MNFREALAVLFRGLSIVLFRAGVIAAGGFMIIFAFGMLLVTFRLAGGVSRGAAVVIAAFFALAVAAGGLAWQCFFLYRLRAAMLLLFSGRSLPAFPLAAARREAKNYFKNYSQWQALNHWLRRTLAESGPATGKAVGLPVVGSLSQAVLVLAFSRDKDDIGQSAREGAALFRGCADGSRRLAQQWLWLSLLG
ncbi:MAG TPA: hypothetical protein VLQ89_07405, partial [Candidatus Binatia bacterium]|nr:hypothetical protein [Candidatus Binatia bacterium]